MSIAAAINKSATSLGDGQKTYKANVIEVNTYITSVLTSSLPTLNTYPPDWADYTAAYTQANVDALDWVNNVLARLLEVPEDVQNYNAAITGALTDAQTQAQALIEDPNNSTALATLNADLTTLTSTISLVTSFISGALTAVQNFNNKMPDMAAQLQTIATKSAQDAQADQDQIDALKTDIANLQAEIKSLTASLIGLGIAEGVVLTMGIAITIAAWPEGALAWFVLGPVALVGGYYIVMDGIQLSEDNAKLASDQQQMSSLTADVSTLQILSQNYTTLSDEADGIENSLAAILAEWQTLENDVVAAASDVQAAISDTSTANFQAVANDLADAVTEWNAAYEQAGDLQLDLQVNDAQLTMGMSSEQVQSAMAAGTSKDVITYFNSM